MGIFDREQTHHINNRLGRTRVRGWAFNCSGRGRFARIGWSNLDGDGVDLRVRAQPRSDHRSDGRRFPEPGSSDRREFRAERLCLDQYGNQILHDYRHRKRRWKRLHTVERLGHCAVLGRMGTLSRSNKRHRACFRNRVIRADFKFDQPILHGRPGRVR